MMKGSVFGRRTLLAGGGGLMLAAPAIAHAQTSGGVALVIGNSKYQWEASLPNVKRDAPDIARRFQAMGLKTDLVQDAGLGAMKRAIDAFTASSRGANLAAFYFAGHGAAWQRDTYLVPADADLADPKAVSSLIPVPVVSKGIEGARHRLMVFDNCRNSPADGWRQKDAEFSAFVRSVPGGDAPNTLTLYSTAPGRLALDGPPGENSPFAASLLRQLDGQTVDLQALAPKVRRDLLIATQGRQVLWDHSTYAAPVVVKGAAGKITTNSGGWAGDPSKIIEFTNAYAFARENNMPLPPGLVAHRAPASSPHATKVGSFKFSHAVPGGGMANGMLAILSAEEQDKCEIILVTRRDGVQTWLFLRSALSGSKLDYMATARGPRFLFDWKDASGGSLTIFPVNAGGGPASYNSRFTRLDG